MGPELSQDCASHVGTSMKSSGGTGQSAPSLADSLSSINSSSTIPFYLHGKRLISFLVQADFHPPASQQFSGSAMCGVSWQTRQTEVIPNSPKEATVIRADTLLFHTSNMQQDSVLPKHKDKLSSLTLNATHLKYDCFKTLRAQGRTCRSSTVGQQNSGSELRFPGTGTGLGITSDSRNPPQTQHKV